MAALEDSGCAKRLKVLSIDNCNVGEEETRALADLLCRDDLPALEDLSLHGNADITDAGVVALADALLKSTKTSLRSLILSIVGMGDEGIAALSSLIYQGRMEQIRDLSFAENDDITDEGINVLARAVEAHMLPLLEYIYIMELKGMTITGIRAIGHAVIKGCPQLEDFTLEHDEVDKINVLQCLLKAAGHKATVDDLHD